MKGDLVWPAPRVSARTGEAFAVRHVWCVGRNYAEHAREMGADPKKSEPVFFSKPAQALVQSKSIAYPARTLSLHHEVELAVLLAAGGRAIPACDWDERIWGYGVAVDLTRRDVQAECKAAGRPWELSKGFDQSAPIGPIQRRQEWQLHEEASMHLSVNGERRQFARLGDMVWPVAELLSRLSEEVTLNTGDVILTGTPAGVADLQRGDRLVAVIDGLPELAFQIA